MTYEILKLERDIKQASNSLETQFRCIDAFIKDKEPLFDSLKQRITSCKKGASRFEWVDSVLIQAVTEGDWAVFENANLCNPSILDRLNPLLEEGN